MSWEPSTDSSASSVAANHFGLSIQHLEQLNRESANGLFRISDGRQRYLLKRLARPATSEWLAFQAAVTKSLFAAGFPIQPLLTSVSGETTVSAHGHGWQLRPYAEGQPFPAGDPAAIDAAASCLYALHHNFSAQFLHSPAGPTQDIEGWLAADEHDLAVIGAFTGGHVDDRYVQAFRQARAALDMTKYRRLPHYLTHGEFAGSNLLYQDGRVTCVLDWDAVEVRPRAYDLARACFFLARKKRGQLDVHADLALRFLRVATRGSPLSDDERAAIIPILELYFLPSTDYLSVIAQQRPDILKWYLDWSATGAATVRAALEPVVDEL